MEGGGFRARYGPGAVVLGGARGIGFAFARALAERGLDLVLVDVRPDLLDRACRDLERESGVEVGPAVVDLGSEGAGDALREALAGRDVGLGVFCAVRSLVGPFLEERLEEHRSSVAVNCGGAVVACHVLGERLRRRGSGGLIVLSSLAGLQGTGWVASYAAAKAFDLVLAEALAWELEPHGVDVLALVAGSTDTPGFRAHRPRIDPGALPSADAVAAEGLEQLGRRRFHICGEENRRVWEALSRLPREERVRAMSEATRRLYADAAP